METRSDCELATTKSVRAFFHSGTLMILAEGETPTPCQDVTIEQSMLEVEPPTFQIVQCRRPGVCTEQVTPYAVSDLFAIGAYRATICVHDSKGASEVAVERIREYSEAGRQKVTLAGGGGAVPVPYLFPPSVAGNEVNEATGYSREMDFSEAFLRAIRALPAPADTYPDQLTRVRVVEIGAEFGGFAGLHHMYVRVEREPEERPGHRT